MRTALTETCVYHVRYPSIGPELRRQAIHSSSNICRAVLSVEARLHCQLLVWRENNVPAEVANVGESCMQRNANMLDCTDRSSINSNSNSFNLSLCILAALLSNHVCMDVFLMHLPPFMSSSLAELCSPSPGVAWGSSTAPTSAACSAFTTASKHTARIKTM